MGVNSLWRSALLTASRNLRQNMLRGRIWNTDPKSDDDEDNLFNLTPASAPPHPTPPNRRSLYGAYQNGHVRGMVENFERSGSASDDSAGDRPRSRSGSVSSQGSGWSPGEAEAPLSDDPLVGGAMPYGTALQGTRTEAETEPSMEELLQSVEPDQGSWGARAWEEDSGIWSTAKRVVIEDGDIGIQPYTGEGSGNTDGITQHLATTENVGVDANDDSDVGFERRSWSVGAEGGRGKGKTRGKKERRRITAIFAGETAGRDGEGDEDALAGRTIAEEEAASTRAPTQEKAQAQADLEETKALLEAFKRRLEEIEAKVDHMEKREKLLATERRAASARQEEEIRRKVAKLIEDQEVQRRRMEENRLSLALVLKPHLLYSRILHYVSRPASGPSLPTAMPDSPTPSSPALRQQDASGLHHALHPTTLSALPSYVLLVSLGMCAVVLRVVIKRFLGRRRSLLF
jgi:hypothetical protein